MSKLNTVDQINGIAVIGMSCRFPGAKNIDGFWRNLREGVESVTFFSDRELIESGIDSSIINHPNYVKAGYILDDIDLFDNSFFGYSPREAEIIDPQQRLFLECVWEALEDGGYVPQTYKGLIGIFGGVRISSYVQSMTSNLNRIGTAESLEALIGNDKDYLTTRISYKLNLKGPSVTIQTACSTSLVAVHMACESLRNEECDMALAGGSAIIVPQKQGYFHQEGLIFSSDGHCRAFDAKADGMVAGNGLGVVLLKRVSDALTDGDHIYAVIRGSAVNNDGWSKVGYTAPGLEGQATVIAEALAMTDVEVETITYIETHGTGTFLGDPIEVEALNRVFCAETDKKGFCAIGSVKTNIGHVDMAAGVAGLIKTALALKYRQLPPSLNFENPNPRIDFSNSPFFVNTKLSEWKTDGYPRRAGVSSFGIGGTNAHVVLEEVPAPRLADNDIERPMHLMTLSARSENALKELVHRFETFLENHPDASLADVCFTANVGRTHFPYRLAVAAESTQQLREQMAAFAAGSGPTGLVSGHVQKGSHPKVAFLFTGQGSQYVGMGQQVYYTQPTFRKALDRCAEILKIHLDRPLLSVIFEEEGDSSVLDETAYTQPALFALEYALAEMWRSWGIEPSVVMGHSVGEYVAACVAGVFSLENGLKLIAARGRLIQALPQEGEMAAVFAGEGRVAAAVAPYANDVSIAAINGPENVVITGVRKSVRKILEELASEGIRAVDLKVSHAFHSPLMEPMLTPFEEIAAEVEYSAPRIGLISNVTGQPVENKEVCEASYWRRHVRNAVRFELGMKTLYEQGYKLFLEIGSSPVLSGMGRRCLPEGIGVWLPSLRKKRDDWEQILESLGDLYVHEVSVNWTGFDQDYSRRRISLPTYPFERKSFWVKKTSVEPREVVPDGTKIWDSLVKAGMSQAERGISKLDLKKIIEYKNFSGILSANYAGLALKKLGAFLNADEWFSVDELLNQFLILTRYRQLLTRLLEWLVQYEQLNKKEREAENVYGKLLTTQHSLDMLIKKGKTLYTELTEMMDFFQSCGSNLADILIGKKDPVKVIFTAAGGTFDMEKFYGGLQSYVTYFNGIFKEIFQSIIRSVPSDRYLRILEIGAGTGATARFLLPLLPQNRTTYMFTDISPIFLNRSERIFGEYSFVQYKLLDIQESLKNQGVNNSSFDVVIAANVLFLTRDLHESLQHVHSLLAPGGILLIQETTEPQPFYDVNLGSLLPVLKDEELRKGWPFLSKAKWKELLKSHNFDKVEVFPGVGSEDEHKALGISVIVAHALSNEEVKAPHAFTISTQTKRHGVEYEMESLSPEVETRTTTNPLIGRRLRSALPVFEAKLDPHLIPYLMEHKFFGEPIAAISVFVQMIEEGAKQVFRTDSITIKDFTLSSPLIFSGGRSQTVQLFFIHDTADKASFRLYRHLEGKDDWNLNVSGKVCISQTSEDKEHLSIDDIQKRCQDVITGEEYDNFIKKIGFEALSGILNFWRRDGECLGEVQLPEKLNSEAMVYRVHPVMMDSCMQVWGPSLPELYHYLKKGDIEEEIDINEVSLMVPVKIDHIKFYRSILPNRLWSHTILRQQDEELIVDYHVFDQNGVLVGEIIGAHQTNMSRQIIERNIRGDLSAQQIDEAPSSESVKLLNQIRNSSRNQQIDLLQDYLNRTVAQLLRLDDKNIPVDRELIQLGLDSLIFLNLAQIIGKDLQVKISIQETFKDLTIANLANRLADYILAEPATKSLDIMEAVGGEIIADHENRYLPFPLTDIQYAYWIGRSGFLKWGNVPCHAYLEFEKEEFNLECLGRFNLAWQRVIERHDMLRAVILPDGQQQIQKHVPQYEIKTLDLRGQDSKRVTSRLDAIRKDMENQVLKVHEWPPFEIRATLFDNDHVRLHFSLDLLIFDPMSLQIAWRDLDRFYRNPEIELEPLELSFRDYVLTESKIKDSDVYERAREYWVNHLSTLYPAPELPLVIDPGKVVKPKFTDRTFYLEPESWVKFKAKAYEAGLTPSSLLMSAYIEVLSMWSKNPCFTINVTHFNRQPLHPQVNEIIGDFTSVLLLATDNRDRVPFMERAQNIQKKLWEAMEHRYFSGVQVLRELSQKKGNGPVFMPIVFTSLISLGDRFDINPDNLEHSTMGDVVYTTGQTPQVMLDNQVQLRGETLVINWESVDNFFPPGLMDDMFEGYYNLIRRLADVNSTQ